MVDEFRDFDIIIEDERWALELGDADGFARACVRAAAAIEPRAGGGGALLFADDDRLCDLNRRFREKDKPTNVLSFPSGGAAGAFLGNIAIAFETCRREAAEQGVVFRDHAAHLIVHGLLHLVGYDHEEDEEANAMERLETRILAALGVSDPYARGDGWNGEPR
jgi:probable rRNA maturation factor